MATCSRDNGLGMEVSVVVEVDLLFVLQGFWLVFRIYHIGCQIE